MAGRCHPRVLIEDKIRAPLQPRQAERYRARAKACGAAAIIIAPSGWLTARPDAVRHFHGSHSIEDLAKELRTRGVQVLEALAKPPVSGTALDDAPTIAFRDYCINRLQEMAPSARPSPTSLHTIHQGWLWFIHPQGLGFKASNGRVDLTVKDHGFAGSLAHLERLLVTHRAPDSFTPALDTARNVVLRHDCGVFDSRSGIPIDTTRLDRALEACARLTEWFDHGGSALLERAPAGKS